MCIRDRHYAPCSAASGAGFQVVVVLPRGTNGPKPDLTPLNGEDETLTACNKWLLAHPDSDEAKGGAKVGLRGENIDIANPVSYTHLPLGARETADWEMFSFSAISFAVTPGMTKILLLMLPLLCIKSNKKTTKIFI